MSSIGSLIQCPLLQGRLDTFMGTDPTAVREVTGLVNFLTSELNTDGVLQSIVSPGNGKKREIELRFQQRALESAVSDSTTQICTSSNLAVELSLFYLVPADGVSYDFQIPIVSLITHCEDDEYWFEKQLQRAMDVCIRKMDTKVATQLVALTGNFPTNDKNSDGSAIAGETKDVWVNYPPFNTNGPIVPTPNLMQEVDYSFQNMGWNGGPVIFGWGQIYKWFKALQLGAVNFAGLDIGKIMTTYNGVFVPDYRIENSTSFGVDHFVAMAPRAAQILFYNQFVGANGIQMIDTEIYKQTIIQDPSTGIPFDMTYTFSCGVISVQVRTDFVTVALPTDMFDGTDRLAGVNWINKFHVVAGGAA